MTTADSRVNCLTATPTRSRGACPSFAARFARLKLQRAQGMPGARCARSLVCKNKKAYEHSHHGHTGFTRHSPHNGFNGFLRTLPGDRACLSPSSAEMSSANLTPASRRQDHTTSPSASRAVRQKHHQRPPHPVPNVRDDRETPLCVGQDGALIILIWVKLERKCFCKWDWTAQISLIRLNKLHLPRRANSSGSLFTCLPKGCAGLIHRAAGARRLRRSRRCRCNNGRRGRWRRSCRGGNAF